MYLRYLLLEGVDVFLQDLVVLLEGYCFLLEFFLTSLVGLKLL